MGEARAPLTGVAPLLRENAVSGRPEPTAAAIAGCLERARARYLVRGALARLAVAALVAVWLFSAVLGVAVVDTDAMAPVAGYGDIALFTRGARDVAPGDVVVFTHDGRRYLGRVVAGVGAMVEVTDDGGLRLDGNLQDALYGRATGPVEGGPAYPVSLAADEYFVLADNRASGQDSRLFGPVGRDDIQGTVFALVRGRGL